MFLRARALVWAGQERAGDGRGWGEAPVACDLPRRS